MWDVGTSVGIWQNQIPSMISHVQLLTSHFPVGLLRKEVIQPHLPIRLPCYDFTPITDPTFDGCLPFGSRKSDVGYQIRVDILLKSDL